MPGPICKAVIDSGRAIAAAKYYEQMVESTTRMVTEAIERGVLAGNDPRVSTLNDKLCYWAEKQEEWSATLLALGTEIALSTPLDKKGN